MDGVLDPTTIRVEGLDRSPDWYGTYLDYEERGRDVYYDHDGRIYESGDAWGHLAVRAGDPEEYWASPQERGAEDYRDPESGGGSYHFTKMPDGHEVEVVERPRSYVGHPSDERDRRRIVPSGSALTIVQFD